VSINTSPAAVRMTVTQPQKYVVWTEMIFSETAMTAPSETASVHSPIGAVPLQSVRLISKGNYEILY
jgi:hypothetical protein